MTDKQTYIIDKNEINRIDIELTISKRLYWLKCIVVGFILSCFASGLMLIIPLLLGSISYGFEFTSRSMIKMMTTDITGQFIFGALFVCFFIMFTLLRY